MWLDEGHILSCRILSIILIGEYGPNVFPVAYLLFILCVDLIKRKLSYKEIFSLICTNLQL